MEGVVIDELNKIHVLDPQIFEKTVLLKDESSQFLDAVSNFQKMADDLISLAEKIGQEVESEKLKAIGSRNYLNTIVAQRENKKTEFRSLIRDRSQAIERLRVEHESLLRMLAEQQEYIDKLEMNFC